MALSDSNDWKPVMDLAGAIASIIGLFVSWLAWQRAKGAEEAAKAARDAVRSGSAAEELRRIAIRAKEMLNCVQNVQYSEARGKCADLIVEVSLAMTRWTKFLSSDERENLEKARGKVRTVSRALQGEIAADVQERLLNSCHEIVIRLAESTGSIINRVEGEEGPRGRTN